MKRSRVMVLVAVLAGSLFLANSVRAFVGGEMIWEKTFNFPGYDTIVIGAVAASTSTLIICGTAYNYLSDTGDIGFIRAFDLVTGDPDPKWKKQLSAGQNRNSFNSLAVVGNTVLVEGYSSSYTYDAGTNLYIYTLNQSNLQAYKADTGESIWGPINQIAAPINLGPINIVTANNRVFVVRKEKGLYDISGSTGNCIVQAYQVATPNLSPMALLLE